MLLLLLYDKSLLTSVSLLFSLQVSSTQPGVFRVICVFDNDTVLDHFGTEFLIVGFFCPTALHLIHFLQSLFPVTFYNSLDIHISSLLEQERSMKSKFRPGFSIKEIKEQKEEGKQKTFGHVAKTSFHIKKLLSKLEAMSINYKMLQVD